MRRLIQTALVATAVATAACSNAGEGITVPTYSTGGLVLRFSIDVDADEDRSDGDLPVPGVRVALFSVHGTDTLAVKSSEADGHVQFLEIPLGEYRYAIDHRTIGDSLTLIYADTSGARLLARLDSLAYRREILLSYPKLSVAETRAAGIAKRVILFGKLLARPQSFRLEDAFVADTSGAIRLLRPTSVGGTALAVGDSVRIIGVTGLLDGQVVLREAQITSLGAKLPPIVRTTTVTEARTAGGGALDARLVQVSGVEIADTTVVDPDFHVTLASITDPDDRVTVVVDQLFDVVHSLYRPGRSIVVRGVLTPVGDGTWVLRPRSAADITFP